MRLNFLHNSIDRFLGRYSYFDGYPSLMKLNFLGGNWKLSLTKSIFAVLLGLKNDIFEVLLLNKNLVRSHLQLFGRMNLFIDCHRPELEIVSLLTLQKLLSLVFFEIFQLLLQILSFHLIPRCRFVQFLSTWNRSRRGLKIILA